MFDFMHTTARGTAGGTARPTLGKPPAPVPRSCSSCFIWSRSGIGNSFNRNPHPLTDPNARECMMRLRHLHDCLFVNLRRCGEFLCSPDQMATAWSSEIILADRIERGPDECGWQRRTRA